MTDKPSASTGAGAGVDPKTTASKPADPKPTESKLTDSNPAGPKSADPKPATGGTEGKAPAAKDAAKEGAPKGAGTKAEEDALKVIMDQLKAETGSSLKDLPSPFKPSDLKKYSTSATEPPAGTRAPVDRLDLIDQVLLNGTFPVALTFSGDGISHAPSGVSITPAFRKLGSDERKAIAAFFVQEHLASFPNAGHTYVQAFESEALAKIHQSEAMHLIFESGGNAVVEGVNFGGGTSSSNQSSQERSSKLATRDLHVSMVREEVILSIRLPRALIEVPKDRQATYDAALARFEREAERIPAADREGRLHRLRLNLLETIQRLGLVVPTVYLLGGRLTSSTSEHTSESIDASTRTVRTRFASMFSAEVPLVGGGKAKGGVETANTESNTNASASQSHGFQLESTGGDSTLAGKPQEWVRSLSNAGSVAVIGWQEPLPIWDFFDAPLKARFQRLLPLSFLTDLFEERVKDGLARQTWWSTLQAEAAALAKTSFSRKDLDVKQVSKSFGIKAPKLPSALPLHDSWKDVDYALVGNRVREQAVVAAKDHVITYFSMSTNFDPPGVWRITSGGLRQEELTVEMESETLRGFNWHIEAEQALKADILPSPTLTGDIVCLKALQFSS